MSFQSVSYNPSAGEFTEGQVFSQESAARNTPIFQNTGYAMSITPGDGNGVSVAPKVTEVSSGDLSFYSGGILNTARNSGMAVQNPDHIGDNTMVTVNGMEMSALSAAQLGILERSPEGRYSEGTGGNASKKPDGVTADTAAPEVEPHNPAISNSNIETALEIAAGELGGYEALDRQAISAISGLAMDDISGATKGLAAAVGVEPEEAQDFIQSVYDGFREQSAKYISGKHGVNGDEVFEWAAMNLTPQEKSSLFHHVYLGRSSVLDNLTQRYQKAHRKG